MIIFPAIDLRKGRVVRLVEGDPNRETVHGDDPLAMAAHWRGLGAQWLHVINLDGAFGEATLNLSTISRIAQLGIPVQFGGGIRSLEDVDRALDSGARRVILGTLVVQNPDIVARAVAKHGAERVVIALDAKDTQVVIHGWQEKSHWTPAELGCRMAEIGARYALYTDVSRDGLLKGPNVEATAQLALDTGLKVIASGGISSLDDIRALRDCPATLAGMVIGKALYTEVFTLTEAIMVARGLR